MRLLYILYFNAPMGGLHENVYASALYMKKRNCDVHVVLKPGILQERLEKQGINTVPTDFFDTNKTVSSIEDLGIDFDLIHFHPGPSKNPALKFGKRYNIPMVETFHGMWHDNLNKYIWHLNAIVAVSGGVRDNLQNKVGKYYEKYAVLPNGYNPHLFNKPRFYKNSTSELNIGFITRFDKDKQFIMDILLLAVNYIRHRKDVKINIHMIGEGILKEDFLNLCSTMLQGAPHSIVFKGWLTDQKLKEAYLDCDIILAPGRSAIEGMISGKPVIAIGSKKYIGLIKHDNWQQGVYNNFGGFGYKFKDYEVGSVESDLDILLDNRNNIRLIGEFSHNIAKQYFNADQINSRLYELYRNIIISREVETEIKRK